MMNTSGSPDLTISMLETLFRGRDLQDADVVVLPNGEFLSPEEMTLLFKSYTAR